MPKAIPDGYHSITPYLAVQDAARAIEFYKTALGATEIYRLPMPGGKIGHAELQIGTSRIMLADETPEWGNVGAKTVGGSPTVLVLYTEDVSALADRFVNAGGRMLKPLETHFYGDRSGQFQDPEGYKWNLSEHVEDVSPEEIQQRMAQMPPM